jgi:hypothetical protein
MGIKIQDSEELKMVECGAAGVCDLTLVEPDQLSELKIKFIESMSEGNLLRLKNEIAPRKTRLARLRKKHRSSMRTR